MARHRIVTLSTTTVVIGVMFAARASGQAPLDTVNQLRSIAREVVRIGAASGNSIWPGYRPDTIPLSFVLPSRGNALFGWRGALPAAYVPVAGVNGAGWRDARDIGAASTAITLSGHRVAQVVVNSLEPATLVGTAMHEAFHVFEAASRSEAMKFGRGENSMLVATYPPFDVENETQFALEGRLLAAALAAPRKKEKADLARQFVAVRRMREARLSSEYAEFEQLSELNEGLAEYALVRALQMEAAEGPPGWRRVAATALALRTTSLQEITGSANLSLRFRFYQTGPAQALLLDAIGNPAWKVQMLKENSTLQDMLALVSGVDSVSRTALATAEDSSAIATLRSSAQRRVQQLQISRRTKVDSLFAQSGLRLVLASDLLPRKGFNPCGYDPQNLLPVTPTLRIHSRWWKPCAGGPTSAEFNVPSVADDDAGTVSGVIGPDSLVKMSANGQSYTIRDGQMLRDLRGFRLDAPRASVQAANADVELHGAVLTVHPKP